MSLYDKSSLLQVPSLYKDGTLVSTIPEDRSGDFTVVRGSNLSATRIGPDGYIKKGYDNLLYPSNNLASLCSNNFNGTASDSNQIANPVNGEVTADKLYTIVSGTSENRARISGYIQNGVQTISMYAKYIDYKYLYIRQLASSNNQEAIFDIELGEITFDNLLIESKIEPAGNGWYRCSITFNASSINNNLIDIGLSGSATAFRGNVQDGVEMYFFGYMLNQGLIAYPYLETTDAPAQGGLLENTPRLDWSNGVPSVLVEEGRTNLVPQTEYITIFSNVTPTYNTTDTLSPEGLYNALKAEAIGSNPRVRTQYTASDGVYTLSLFVKQGSSSYLKMVAYDRTNNHEATFNLTDGTFSGETTGVTAYSQDYGNGWYRCAITYTSAVSDTGLNYGQAYVNNGSTGNAYTYGYQAEQASTPSSYIPTYGTTQTRSNEVISDDFSIPTTATIYNSFYSDVAETVFVFDQVFNVVEGLNKVAIAFSPTAVKISVGGSIVANATGTYDTTSLTNIQLGSNNGTDYSNAPISGFYVFPEFLTDEELNSLTD